MSKRVPGRLGYSTLTLIIARLLARSGTLEQREYTPPDKRMEYWHNLIDASVARQAGQDSDRSSLEALNQPVGVGGPITSAWMRWGIAGCREGTPLLRAFRTGLLGENWRRTTPAVEVAPAGRMAELSPQRGRGHAACGRRVRGSAIMKWVSMNRSYSAECCRRSLRSLYTQ